MSYIYLIQSVEFYKIGIANDVESRLSQLQTGNPNELAIVSCYEFPNVQAVETVLHQKFNSFRKLGEWFHFYSKEVKQFDEICEMLGGVRYSPNSVISDQSEVEEAEEIQETAMTEGAKFDYAQMFADGWRMETVNENGKKRNWVWRRGNDTSRKTMYGGSMNSLPYPIEEMRRIYRDRVEK